MPVRTVTGASFGCNPRTGSKDFIKKGKYMETRNYLQGKMIMERLESAREERDLIMVAQYIILGNHEVDHPPTGQISVGMGNRQGIFKAAKSVLLDNYDRYIRDLEEEFDKL
jgi:hypothetical protein